MPALRTVRMTLTGPLKGKTKLLNRHQFTRGVAHFTGTDEHIIGVTKYFTRSYQVNVVEAKAEAAVAVEEVEDKEAIRVDDSDVLSDKQLEELEEGPNSRQAEIIAAVNQIEKDKWVDLHAETPRPKAADVKEVVGDPTITVTEIVEVIKTWLS